MPNSFIFQDLYGGLDIFLFFHLLDGLCRGEMSKEERLKESLKPRKRPARQGPEGREEMV
jgi:hypothetical protein